MKLEGKVAIVTASGRGIGRGIAICLGEEGAKVTVNSYHEETSSKVASEITAMGRRALAVAGDITQPEVIMRVIQETLSTFGKVDIVVNNVGGGGYRARESGASLLDAARAEWDATYEQNLRATALMCRAITPHFMEQRSGKIVNVASIAGRHAFPGGASYGAMKAALIKYTQSLARELGPHNINVNAICPGLVYTDVWQRRSQQMVETVPAYKGMTAREWFAKLNEGRIPEMAMPPSPLGREQTPEDMGRAVVFFVSEDSRNITGQALNVDGGRVNS